MEREHGGRERVYRGRGYFGEEGFDEGLPRALEGIAIDVEGLEDGQQREPAGQGVHFVSPDTDRVKLVKIDQSVGQSADAGRIRNDDAKMQ